MSDERLGWLTVSDDDVAIGDPRREHLLLTLDGVAHRRLDLDAQAVVEVAWWSWDDVADLVVSAPTSRTARPGLWAFLRATVAEATGFGSTLTSADVRVRVVLEDGAEGDLLLDGHTGAGYPSDEQEWAHALLREVVSTPSALPRIRTLIAQSG